MDSVQHIQRVPDWSWPAKRHAQLDARARAIAGRMPEIRRVLYLARARRALARPMPAAFLARVHAAVTK